MKTLLAVVLAALCAGSAFAQITVTQSHAPGVGTSMTTYTSQSDVNWSPGSGANQTWNIAAFQYDFGTATEYISPAGTPYSDLFPTATLCVNLGDVSYTYMRVAADGIYIVGMATAVDTFEIIQDPDQDWLVLRFPCTMGTNWTSVLRITTELVPGFSTTTVDSSLNTVDGWGTLTTPAWSEQALRVYSHGYFSTYMNGMPIGETTEDFAYMWVTQNSSRSANYSNPDATGPGFTTGSLDYASSGTSAVNPPRGPVAESFKLSQNYPNPFNPSTQLPIELSKATKIELTIYNEVGQVVSSQEFDLSAGQHSLPIDGSSWGTGNYFARVTAGTEAQTTRMVLVK